MTTLDDWDELGMPHHFLERLLRRYSYIKFAVVDVFNSHSSLPQTYHVSNFPSAIYFDTNGRFKLLDTYSTNPDARLDHDKVHDFIESLPSEEGWFDSPSQLANFLQNVDYHGHKYHRPGFNVIQDRFSDPNEDDNDVLEHLEL